ncbi:hypothetical protein C8R47DRAFT_1103060 [Mycena vitilis]|nr:hypothetical protein C8R47DRAFT_1103060 [Mycena vitilis]
MFLFLMWPSTEQRGSTPGTLLTTEASVIALRAGGYGNVSGIWSDEQIAAWKKVFLATVATK